MSPSKPHMCILLSVAKRILGNFYSDQCHTPAKNPPTVSRYFQDKNQSSHLAFTNWSEPTFRSTLLSLIPQLDWTFSSSKVPYSTWSLANIHSLYKALTDSPGVGLPVLDPMPPEGAWHISSPTFSRAESDISFPSSLRGPRMHEGGIHPHLIPHCTPTTRSELGIE